MTPGASTPCIYTDDYFFAAVGDHEFADTFRSDIAGTQRGSTPVPDGCDDYPSEYWAWLVAEYDLWRDTRPESRETLMGDYYRECGV